MNQPKISLILIYNNAEETLKNCIESILKQSFQDFELICINNGSTDNSEDIAKDFAAVNERIKLISLPQYNEEEVSKKMGIAISSGDFICFISSDNILPSDFIKEKYFDIISNKNIKLENNRLYRRTFIENDKELAAAIEEKVLAETNRASDILKSIVEELKEEFDIISKKNIETINNSSYELTLRFNQLESLFYNKNSEFENEKEQLFKDLRCLSEESSKQIYSDISKVYDYINSEINKKGCEINKVYEEITKNYQYTEEIVQNKDNDIISLLNNDKDLIYKKLNELEKEIIVRYVNLKRLLDMNADETESKLQAVTSLPAESINHAANIIDIEKSMNENIDKIYSHINNTNNLFYEELTKLYKELNEKIQKIKEDPKKYSGEA